MDDAEFALGSSTAERLAAVLRDEIAGGAYKPDELLPPEHVLIERFGVSRPTYRESLRILQSEGLVSPLRGNKGGAKVNLPNPERISLYAGVYLQMRGASHVEVLEARCLVEPEAAARVARSGDASVFSTLAQIVTAQRYLINDQVAFYRAGRQFRRALLNNCGSDPIRLFGLMLGYISDRQLSAIAERVPPREAQVGNNRRACEMKDELVEALNRHDEEAARRIWLGYLQFYIAEQRSLAQSPAATD